MDRKAVEAKIQANGILSAKIAKTGMTAQVGVVLADADLSGADLSGLDLTRANLHKAKLNGANLKGTKLTRANCHGADLSNASFDAASDFCGANLCTAILDASTGLAGVKFLKANLRSCSAKGTGLDVKRKDLFEDANVKDLAL